MKYVHNTHQAEIRVSLPAVEDTPASELVLEPGDNAVTHEQYRALRKVPVIVNYFKVGFLRDTAGPPQEDQPPPPPPVGGVTAGEHESPKPERPLDKMNKAELLARATELGLTVDPEATNAAIREAITAATAQ